MPEESPSSLENSAEQVPARITTKKQLVGMALVALFVVAVIGLATWGFPAAAVRVLASACLLLALARLRWQGQPWFRARSARFDAIFLVGVGLILMGLSSFANMVPAG